MKQNQKGGIFGWGNKNTTTIPVAPVGPASSSIDLSNIKDQIKSLSDRLTVLETQINNSTSVQAPSSSSVISKQDNDNKQTSTQGGGKGNKNKGKNIKRGGMDPTLTGSGGIMFLNTGNLVGQTASVYQQGSNVPPEISGPQAFSNAITNYTSPEGSLAGIDLNNISPQLTPSINGGAKKRKPKAKKV